jgi:hypothetical protein
MRRREYALKTFVHRVLARRLVAAGAIVAVAFAAIAYARGYERVGDTAVLTAHNGIEWMRVDMRRLDTTALDRHAAMQQVLGAEPACRTDRRYGRFVYVRFFDARGGVIGERATPIQRP